MAKAWKVRPSELYCIEDPYEAFRFDRAVFTFGTALTAELDKVEGNSKNPKETERKRKAVFDKWMNKTKPSDGAPRFRDPVNR